MGRSTPPFRVFRYQHLPPTPPHENITFNIYEEKFLLLAGGGFV